jgi:hypothetical protein
METQEFKFNTFRATVDSANWHSGVPYYAVELEYYKDRTHELMGYKTHYEFAQSLDLEQSLDNINTQAELVTLIDEYTTRLGGSSYMGDDSYGVSEDTYLDLAVHILEKYFLK